MSNPETILAEPTKVIMPWREMRGYTEGTGLRDAMDTREMDKEGDPLRSDNTRMTFWPPSKMVAQGEMWINMVLIHRCCRS